MKKKLSSLFVLFSVLLGLAWLISCGSANFYRVKSTPTKEPATLTTVHKLAETATAALTTATDSIGSTASGESLTLTAVMGATLNAVPTNTPPPWATILPSPGDLGWGPVYGRILETQAFTPIQGATVRCEQTPVSPYSCQGTTLTDQNGNYSFSSVFFRAGDRITLIVEAPGYLPLRFEEAVQTYPQLYADLGLDPLATAAPQPQPEPILMCTPPICDGGQLTCGSPDGCPGGCGTICSLPTP